MNDGAHSPELMCRWLKIEAAADLVVSIWLPENNCTDMRGAIRVAQMLAPEVEHIFVYEGKHLDIEYELKDGDWVSIDWRRR